MVARNWKYIGNGVVFSSLFFCVQEFPKVDAALWYGGTMAQKIRRRNDFSGAIEE